MGEILFQKILVILCISLNFVLSSHSNSNINSPQVQSSETDTKIIDKDKFLTSDKDNNADVDTARHFDQDVNDNDNESLMDQDDLMDRKSKPLRNIFMGIYKNYKSTYLGNRTSFEYRKSMQDTWTEALTKATTMAATTPTEKEYESTTLAGKLKQKKKKKKKKNKGSVTKKDEALLYSYDGEYRYNIGTGVNVSLDMKRDIVNVNLDEDCLKDILYGKWDDESEGRGKKYEMISKILPLFILPFLIQSAIIPFLVTKLKLLLIKSILIGKLAIFLLVISAIKNNHKVATYEPAPAYWAAEPSRRSEIFNGYRVEGRPTTWVS